MKDYMNMSDEELMAQEEPEITYEEPEDLFTSTNKDEDEDENEEFEDESDEELETEDELDEESNELEEDEDEDETESDDEKYEDDDDEDEESEESDDDEEEEEKEESDVLNYKELYEGLMAPFKANKKEIKVDSPEELRRLAQMGVGYNAKMTEIKPLRKIGKMLENAELLDEAKISYLIDLYKQEPKAINKLIKDSGIDPLDINIDSTDDYKPNTTYTVDDKHLTLSDTLTALEQSTSGREAMEIVSNKWDEKSKQAFLNNPSMFQDLEKQIEDGTYQRITDIVENDRALNKIPDGITDLQAYSIVGQALAKEGNQTPKVVNTKPARSKPVNKEVNKRKKAASSTKGKVTNTKSIPKNPLSLSDDEFEKFFENL